MERVSLREELKKIRDFRRGQGRMHSIDVVLMIAILGTMSDYLGYRALGDFVKKHKKELIKYLKPRNDKLPSFLTIRRVLINLDIKEFKKAIENWVLNYFEKENEKWISVDGKSINGSKEDEELVHMVTFFASKSKKALISNKVDNKSNEIPKVQEMLREFPLKEMIITLDAMHAQEDTVREIIKSGNDYVIQVKKKSK
ncbi:MAG: ISAs1 family transposase [Nautiliaceae bacterium]